MPRFEPFRGLRYDPHVVKLRQVIAPPYDVISSAQRVTLAGRSPLNSVLLELPEPDLVNGRTRYDVAAGLQSYWREQGFLRLDETPAFYGYTMTTPEGTSTTGVVGALAVGPGEDGDILPHEQTLPKPRSDRLDLLRATTTNLSPIWGLSLAGGLTAVIHIEGPPASDAFDDDGVSHQVWQIDDPEIQGAIRASVASAPLVIADGHHRYETARAYRNEVRAANGDEAGGHDLVMAFVVELSADQLHVGPIHRTLQGLPAGTDLVASFGKWFTVVHAGPASHAVVSAIGAARSLALITEAGAFLLTPHPDAFEAAGSELDSALVSMVLRGLPDHVHEYRHSWQEAFEAVEKRHVQAAVLLRPVDVPTIAAWAASGEKMPPKTTYFSPKPRTGMVFRPLND